MNLDPGLKSLRKVVLGLDNFLIIVLFNNRQETGEIPSGNRHLETHYDTTNLLDSQLAAH